MAKFVCSAVRRHFSSRVSSSSFAFFTPEQHHFRYINTSPTVRKHSLHPQACTFHCDRNHSTSTDTIEDCHNKNSSVIALEIMKIVSKVDKMVLSLQLHTIQRQIDALLSAGLSDTEVRTLLTSSPALLHETKIQDFVQFLQSYGFENSDIIILLQKNPRIIQAGEKKIESFFQALQAAGQNGDQITSLLANNPKILTMSTKQVLSRVESLKALFKTQDVFTLILKSPTVLLDDWDTFIEKFMYVFQEMKITQPQMMKCYLFEHPLSHIKSRHLFLMRSGLWFTGKLKGGEKSPNPRLSEIVDSSDQRFTNKFGGMSAMEYKTFCKLLAKEENQQEE